MVGKRTHVWVNGGVNGQCSKVLPGCLPVTPQFASGYLPGLRVFATLQKLNFPLYSRPSNNYYHSFENSSVGVLNEPRMYMLLSWS